MKIRAAVLRESGLPRPYCESKPLQIEEVELDGPKRGEVLVQIKAVGLCHSDLVAINGERGKPMPIDCNQIRVTQSHGFIQFPQ